MIIPLSKQLVKGDIYKSYNPFTTRLTLVRGTYDHHGY